VSSAPARVLLLLLILVAACVPRLPAPPRLTLQPTNIADLPGWREDRTAEALPAFAKSCAALMKLGAEASLGIGGTAGDWRAVCAGAASLVGASDQQARQFFETFFTAYVASNNGATEGLFTGYFEPEVAGARAQGGGYETPLLRRPPDLVAVDLGRFRPAWRGERTAGRVENGRLLPYATRAEIEGGALDRFHLALLWVSDPVDAFILQIQGSGRVRLEDGSLIRVGYDGTNGWPYVAIGHLLIARGALAAEEVSLPAIRAWLAAHPSEAAALMDENPSYVFFREVAGDGPIGTAGVVLTPGRSLAVDPDFVPLNAPVWLDAAQDDLRLRRLMVAQDTGGAIRGPVRGDVFWGFGSEAERRAGNMRALGLYVILLPRGVTPQIATDRSYNRG